MTGSLSRKKASYNVGRQCLSRTEYEATRLCETALISAGLLTDDKARTRISYWQCSCGCICHLPCLTAGVRRAGNLVACTPWLCSLMLLPQFECRRIGTGLAVLEPSCGLGEMISVFSNPRLLKIHDDKPCRPECFPVVRKRSMKPDELRCEMGPGRIRAFPRLEVWEAPAIPDLFAVCRHGCTALWKTRMGEDQHGHTVKFQDSVERVHGSPKVRSIHEHIVRDHHVKVLIGDGAKLGAGIHSEVHIGMLRTCDCDHALGEVNASHESAVVAELF
jgi:hypothetical protein